MPESQWDLDRRIIGALQINGRASWSVIAKSLDEPLRSVSRRGQAMIRSGRVSVVGVPSPGPTCVIEITCKPSHTDRLARELSHHPRVMSVLVLSNPASIMMEVGADANDVAELTLERIPALEGVREIAAAPVLRYSKTNTTWRPFSPPHADDAGLEPLGSLRTVGSLGALDEQHAGRGSLGAVDEAIVRALEEDGRTGVAALAQAAGVTEPTARRRLHELIERGAVEMRALVEPDQLGYTIEACLRLQCSPERVEALGRTIAQIPEVRYVAHVLADFPIIVKLNARDLPHLWSLMSGSWITDVRSMRSSLVSRVYKRSFRAIGPTEVG